MEIKAHFTVIASGNVEIVRVPCVFRYAEGKTKLVNDGFLIPAPVYEDPFIWEGWRIALLGPVTGIRKNVIDPPIVIHPEDEILFKQGQISLTVKR